MNKKIIILSGGMDSTTLLYDLVQKYGNKNVLALSFNYGSRHNKVELPLAHQTCKKLKVKHRVFNLQPIFKHYKSALLNKKDSEEIPEGHYADENMKKTVVPFRNGILLSLAIGLAESEDGNEVYYGAHQGDHTIYPDCRKDFVAAMNNAGIFGTYKGITINAPYSDITKIEIIKKGIELGVDYSLTWTCYNPQEGNKPCGKCGSCVERTEAFEQNGYKDPLYEDEDWIKAVHFMKENLSK